jgi:hypothetical protein
MNPRRKTIRLMNRPHQVQIEDQKRLLMNVKYVELLRFIPIMVLLLVIHVKCSLNDMLQ